MKFILQVQALCLIEVCLKESHLKRSDNISLENYSMYNTRRKEDESGTGGLTLLVRDNILHSFVNLSKHRFTDSCCKNGISLEITIAVCSVDILSFNLDQPMTKAKTWILSLIGRIWYLQRWFWHITSWELILFGYWYWSYCYCINISLLISHAKFTMICVELIIVLLFLFKIYCRCKLDQI